MEDFKEKVTAVGEEVTESVKQGAVNFIDDAATLKHSVDEVADDRQAAKEAKNAERKAQFDSAVADIKESFEQGVEAFKSDMNITKTSIDEVAAEQKAAIEAKDAADKKKFDETVASIKESVEQGVENFKSDMNITRDSIEEVAAEQQAEKAARKAESREKFDEKVDELKKSLE